MNDNEPQVLYGVAAIATFLGIEEKACRHRVEAKQIPTFKIGRMICARPSSLRTWLAAKEAEA